MGGSPVKVLDRFGLLTKRYIGSHGVYLNDEDIEIYAQSGAEIVNTPICEMKIGDGLAPIPKLVKAGIPVALGTDGAMWNNSNDIFREMKWKCLPIATNYFPDSSKTLPEQRILYTYNFIFLKTTNSGMKYATCLLQKPKKG